MLRSKFDSLAGTRPRGPISSLPMVPLMGLLFAGLLSACFESGAGNPTSPPGTLSGQGILEVTLKRGQAVVKGATVFTDPATKVLKTDAYGKATFTEVKPGTYSISAYNFEGSGKSVAIAKSDEVAYVAMDFLPGTTLGPAVNVSLDGSTEALSPGDTLTIRVVLQDGNKPGDAYSVSVSSDLDGALAKGKFDPQGSYVFSSAKLSKGDHVVTVKVSESENIFTERALHIRLDQPVRPEIMGITATTAGVKIAWKGYAGDDFLRYEIWMRVSDEYPGSEKVAEILSAKETEYSISSLPLLAKTPVFVRVYNSDSLYADSRLDTIRQQGVVSLPIQPFHAVMHPTQDVIYAIGDSSRVYRVDISSGAVSSRKMGGRPGYMAIGDNGAGVELYVSNEDGWIYVLNPQDLSTVFQINCGVPVTSVDIDGAGNILASVESRYDAPATRVISRSTGTLRWGLNGNEGTRIRYNHARTAAIAISTRISPVDMVHYSFSGANLAQATPDRYHGDHPLSPETFEISQDDSVLVSGAEGAIYGANSRLEYLAMLPRGDVKYAAYLFPTAGGKLLAGSSNYKKVVVHAVPGWTATGEVAVRGYPLFLFERGGKLFSLSRVSAGSKRVGIETFVLP